MTRFARTGAKVGATLAVLAKDAAESINASVRVPVRTAPPLVLSSGTLEALKWLALMLMTLDHVNKHLLHASVPELFAAGRLALPLFGFVLGYNLARPGALASGGYSRTARRLAMFGTIATIPFIALGGLGWGWWPFNIMATLLVATLCAWLIEAGGPLRLVAAGAVFIVGGRARRVLVARGSRYACWPGPTVAGPAGLRWHCGSAPSPRCTSSIAIRRRSPRCRSSLRQDRSG